MAGTVRLVAACAGTFVTPTAGMVALLLGEIAFFPLTTMLSWINGRPTALPATHPMNTLAMQIAFTVPPGLLVASQRPATRRSGLFRVL